MMGARVMVVGLGRSDQEAHAWSMLLATDMSPSHWVAAIRRAQRTSFLAAPGHEVAIPLAALAHEVAVPVEGPFLSPCEGPERGRKLRRRPVVGEEPVVGQEAQ